MSALSAANWRKEFPEKARAQKRDWRKKFPEKDLAWRKLHPERMRFINKQHNQKSRDNLADYYIRSILSRGRTIPDSFWPPELVECKRIQIKLIRLCQNQKTLTNCETNS